MSKKIQIWLTFTVGITFLPLLFEILLIIVSKEFTFSMSQFLDKGELFIISIAIGGDAIGRHESGTNGYKWYVGICMLLVLVSAFLFAIYSIEPKDNVDYSAQLVSCILFLIILIPSKMCVSNNP